MPQAPTAVLGKSAKGDFPRPFGILALLKPLARDARGEIYVALRPEGVDRLCVVNLLAPSLVDRPGVMDVLRAQAGWLVARVHGNLVQTYDVGHGAERLFLLPEHAAGGGSPRGDVYAVGALLWQMLTGRTLATGSAASHLAALRGGRFEAPRVSAVTGVGRLLPAALEELVGAALARRPEERPA